MKENGLVYDWSTHEGPEKPVRPSLQIVRIDDESLRDGQQGAGQLEASITIGEKKIYLEWADPFIDHSDVGFPNSHRSQESEAVELIKYGLENRLKMSYSLAGRAASPDDIAPIINVAERLDGFRLRADIFLDGSTKRAIYEKWDRREMIKEAETNIKKLKKAGLDVMFVAERATTTPPTELLELCERAIHAGADRICIADTQGIASPRAMRNITRWSLDKLWLPNRHLKFDAHTHNHLGMANANSLIAAEEGYDEVHGTVFCLGEGAGNDDLATLLAALSVYGYIDKDLTNLNKFYDDVSKLFGYEIPVNAPTVGKSAHSTGSGVHAAALEKELEAGEAASIYLPYSPTMVGAKAGVEIGPMSGQSNVRLKLKELKEEHPEELVNVEYSRELGDILLEKAKSSGRTLNPTTIMALAKRYYQAKVPSRSS